MESIEKKPGVSVVICCYNSARRLLPTLQYLAAQQFGKPISWEIILVDNASTDSTAVVALEIWESISNRPPVYFRIITERRAGQGFARLKGISKASYEYVLFCDDDNWLSPNYVQGVFNILSGDLSIGACGGLGYPVFETEKPDWFDDYAEAFAVGDQEITREKGRILNLYGAGMAVRQHALDDLNTLGYQPVMAGRTGSSLSSSDDTELTYALVLAGYRLHYDPRLSFSHYMTAGRLTQAYLKNLLKAFGKDGPVRNLYYGEITHRFFHRLVKYWFFHLLLALYRLLKYAVVPPKKNGRSIYVQWSLAYIRELISIRKRYAGIKNNIASLNRQHSVTSITHSGLLTHSV